MLKQHSSFIRQSIALADCALLGGSFALSYELVSPTVALYPVTQYWVMFVGFLAFYLYFAWTRNLFSVLDFTWMTNLMGRVIMIFLSAGILGAAILYVMQNSYNSRTLYFTFTGLSFVAIALEKMLLRGIFASLRRRNRNTTPIVLFGRGRIVTRVKKEIELNPEWGLRVVKTVDIRVGPRAFEEFLKSNYVEEVFFCVPRSVSRGGFAIDPFLQVCEEMGRPARVFLNIPSATRFARWEYHRFMNRPTLLSHTVELDPDQLIFKRIFDIAGGLAGFAALLLAYVPLSIAIKASSPGPVFFRQVRVGRNGKRFVIYKFRSMHADAERRKKELKAQNELAGAVFKIRNDPRITPIGRFMRKLSLDELPQFINVLKGEMSLVGTRPPTPDEVSEYENWHHRRISIKPGVTGLWQVSGRNKIKSFDEIVRLDLRYIDKWSIWLDVRIILKTIVVVLRRGEAY